MHDVYSLLDPHLNFACLQHALSAGYRQQKLMEQFQFSLPAPTVERYDQCKTGLLITEVTCRGMVHEVIWVGSAICVIRYCLYWPLHGHYNDLRASKQLLMP